MDNDLSLQWLKDKIEDEISLEYSEKEKQQIIDAYGQPRVYFDDDFKQMDEINGEQYYNLTFKQD
jgi:hypothetical protein